MGDVNNQNFVQIPFSKLIAMIQYLAKREGIRVFLQEESYTSKASFLDRDPIPVYGEEGDTKPEFSGVRGPTVYKGRRKVQKLDRTTGKRKTTNPQFRGLYYSEPMDRTINSDLNGSANTGRKAIPEMYDEGVGLEPDFNNCRVIHYPDEEHFGTVK